MTLEEPLRQPALLRHPRAALALLSFAQLLIALDATIVFVALDAMGQQLQLDARHLQWVISGYSVPFGGCLLLGGRCADLLGQRRMYVAAMALFGLAPWLAALRICLAVGGGAAGRGWQRAAVPATLSMINTLYAAGAARNRALAVWSMASAGGLAAGACWCLLTQTLGWNWVLWVLVPIAWPCALAAGRYLPAMPAVPAAQRRFDLLGCISVTVGASAWVALLVQGPQWGWADGRTLGLLLLALAALGLFWRTEARVAAPLMPLAMLRVGSLQTSMLLAMLFMSSYGVQYYFLGLYFQQVLGWSPLQAGLAFVLRRRCAPGHTPGRARPGAAGHPQRAAAGLGRRCAGHGLDSCGAAAGRQLCLAGTRLCGDEPGPGCELDRHVGARGPGYCAGAQGVASGVAATAQQVGAALGLALLVMLAAAPLAGWKGLALRPSARPMPGACSMRSGVPRAWPCWPGWYVCAWPSRRPSPAVHPRRMAKQRLAPEPAALRQAAALQRLHQVDAALAAVEQVFAALQRSQACDHLLEQRLLRTAKAPAALCRSADGAVVLHQQPALRVGLDMGHIALLRADLGQLRQALGQSGGGAGLAVAAA
ncbi:MFS transporter [Comamonas sp. JC664]|uniref:MFS transporter n=1 Tax=Comamonas sp. JC664 TaxID=2801917 RepID=UPI00360D100A